MDRLGSPPAAACLDTGRGGTAGDAESNLRLQCLYLNVTLSPHALSFSLDGASLSFQTQSYPRVAEQCAET